MSLGYQNFYTLERMDRGKKSDRKRKFKKLHAARGVIIENDDWHDLKDNVFLNQWRHKVPATGVLRARGNVGIADQ